MVPGEGRGTAKPKLRVVRPSDAAVVALLLGELGYPCSRDEAARRIDATAADPDQQIWLAELEGRSVGLLGLDFMYYLPLGVTTCRITALVVDPSARRHGIGRFLVRQAETMAREAQASRIELTSASHRDEAHAFYRACGYKDGALRFVKALGDC
jgi:GNAT superfamily N-acetyltransferase